MKKATLSKRIRFSILLPILAGSLTTALMALAPVFLQYPSWIDKVMTDIVNDQGEVMMQVSTQVGELSSGFLQIPVYYAVLVGKLMQSYYAGDLLLKTDLPYLQSAAKLEGRMQSAKLLATRDEESQYSSSMWYYEDYSSVQDIEHLASQAYAELQLCARFDSFMLPIASIVGGSRVTGFYYGFSDTELYYGSPSASYPFFNQSTFPCVDGTERRFFTPTCRPWFQAVKNASEQFLATIVPPYNTLEDDIVKQDVCYGVWTDEQIELAICIVFNNAVLDLSVRSTSLAQTSESWAFVMNSDGSVLSYPGYDRSTEKEIGQLMFTSYSEAEAFYENIYPHFVAGTRALEKFELDGDTWLIAIQPVNVDMGTDRLFRRDLSAAVVMRESVLWSRVSALKSESNKVLLIESAIFVCFLVAIMGIGWLLTQKIVYSVVGPLDTLADILERLVNGDLKIEIKEPKEKCSREIRDLYHVFGKLRIAMRFGRPCRSENDAEDLINFSQSLQLFEEFNNIKGMRVCCTKLGKISRRSGRYPEACEYFRRAVEQAKSMLRADLAPEEYGQCVDVLKVSANDYAETLLESPGAEHAEWQQAVQSIHDSRRFVSKHSKAQYDIDGQLLLVCGYCKQTRWSVAASALEQAESMLCEAACDLLVPESIMRERLLFAKACLQESLGNHATAGQMYTECLTLNASFDREIRGKCLNRLLSLFEKSGITCRELEEMIDAMKETRNDVVILMDYSQGMKSDSAISRSVRCVKDVFCSGLGAEDRISLVLFHTSHRVAFSLTPKSHNTEFISRNIDRWTKPTSAQTAKLYDAVLAGLEEFRSSSRKDDCELLSLDAGFAARETERRKQWMLLLTATGDCGSTHSRGDVIRALQQTNVSVFGIALRLDRLAEEALGGVCGKFRNCADDRELGEAVREFEQCLASTHEATVYE